MSDTNLDQQPTAEELQEENKALEDSKEEEIRSSIIEKYELDEEDNEDLIEKLTKDVLAQKKSFGKVVSQKRSWREKALADKIKKDVDKDSKTDSKDDIEKVIEDKFFNRDVEELDYSDEIKEQVKNVAKLQGVSVKKAQENPYIQFLINQDNDEKKFDKSTIKGGKSGKFVKTNTDKILDPNDYDLSTDEGRKTWEKDKKEKYKE